LTDLSGDETSSDLLLSRPLAGVSGAMNPDHESLVSLRVPRRVHGGLEAARAK
jgi:hypothetical protein